MLRALVGGVQPVILGDAAAKQRSRYLGRDPRDARITVLERAGSPTFSMVVELLGHQRFRVHHRIVDTIDKQLAGEDASVEERWRGPSGALYARLDSARESSGDGFQQILDPL